MEDHASTFVEDIENVDGINNEDHMKTTVDNDKSTMTTMMTVSMTITASELS